jgi:hypothetical protein
MRPFISITARGVRFGVRLLGFLSISHFFRFLRRK